MKKEGEMKLRMKERNRWKQRNKLKKEKEEWINGKQKELEN